MRVTLPTNAITLIRRLLPIIQVSVLILIFFLFHFFRSPGFTRENDTSACMRQVNNKTDDGCFLNCLYSLQHQYTVGKPGISRWIENGSYYIAEGVSLLAVTALIVSWVTVGVVQLPAEALLLGRRFAIYRNLMCFLFAIMIPFLTVYTPQLIG
ncbi:MAG: hypothetical protein U9P11_10205 [Pseudomonadota bacterium]|nr:hypothetical protein [Pseudomonadota bacterium]